MISWKERKEINSVPKYILDYYDWMANGKYSKLFPGPAVNVTRGEEVYYDFIQTIYWLIDARCCFCKCQLRSKMLVRWGGRGGGTFKPGSGGYNLL